MRTWRHGPVAQWIERRGSEAPLASGEHASLPSAKSDVAKVGGSSPSRAANSVKYVIIPSSMDNQGRLVSRLPAVGVGGVPTPMPFGKGQQERRGDTAFGEKSRSIRSLHAVSSAPSRLARTGGLGEAIAEGFTEASGRGERAHDRRDAGRRARARAHELRGK